MTTCCYFNKDVVTSPLKLCSSTSDSIYTNSCCAAKHKLKIHMNISDSTQDPNIYNDIKYVSMDVGKIRGKWCSTYRHYLHLMEWCRHEKNPSILCLNISVNINTAQLHNSVGTSKYWILYLLLSDWGFWFKFKEQNLKWSRTGQLTENVSRPTLRPSHWLNLSHVG